MASESPGNDCLQARAKALADVLSKDGEARSETPVTRPTQTPARSGGGRKKSTRGGHF
jgi:hypothetical protein